jgi:hypothetical protein
MSCNVQKSVEIASSFRIRPEKQGGGTIFFGGGGHFPTEFYERIASIPVKAQALFEADLL